jgi:hypothetical protein
MDHVTVDERARAALSEVKSLVEVRDADGRVIGFFAPVALEHAARYAEAAAQTDPLAARKPAREGPTKTTAEVLDQLRSLERG